ncbi:cytochrome P450 [Verrucomicrobia bacterium S94]|nr:cytochrome P450 [Verrucomicrobia bacterium S94]
MPVHPDPFKADRESTGLHHVDVEGENLPLILTHQEVRNAARDYKSFSSDNPLMCVIHSEADVRTVRQLPLEIDPPDHTDYRNIVEPLFKRPMEDEDYMADMKALVSGMVTDAVQQKEIEAVRGFALPLQCRALTRLLNVPESEADEWISWGVHVFHDRDDGVDSGPVLENYTGKQFKKVEENPGNDFFSILNQAEFRGRKLTFEEKQGFANVAFAGGRDTVINMVSSILAYFGDHPEGIDFLREDETRIPKAVEEFVRYVSPLTAITRVCPRAKEVLGHTVPAGGRVGLCWPSANRDASVFENPDEIILDRHPNRHVGFGHATHRCMGAPHARLIMRSLLEALCEQVERIELIEAVPKYDEETSFKRMTGYESVNIRFIKR